MAKRNPTNRGQRDPFSAHPKDKKVERAVLAFLIFRYPEQLTIAELSRVLHEEKGGFDSGGAVERAFRELVGAGLLECRAEFTVPTRAALYFDSLDSD